MASDIGSREPAVDLLIRNPSGAGYMLRTFTALESGLGFRPTPAPQGAYEVNEVEGDLPDSTSYLVRHRETEQIVHLSARGFHLFSEMNGRATILDLVTSSFMKWGAIAPEEVWRTVRELRSAGLVQSRPVDLPLVRHLPSSGLGASLARFVAALQGVSFNVRDIDGWLRMAYALGGRWFFTSAAIYAYIFLVAMGACAFAAQGGLWAGLSHLIQPWRLAICGGLLAPIVVLHEAAHALACTHFRRQVRAMGVRLWAGFLPMPYTDVTDIWMATRHARATVYFAGPMGTALLGCALALCGWALGEGPSGQVLHSAAGLALVIAGLTTCPFLPIETDGYQLFADHVGCLHLREDAWRFVFGGLRARIAIREGLSARERLFVLYTVAVATITGALAAVSCVGLHELIVRILTR